VISGIGWQKRKDTSIVVPDYEGIIREASGVVLHVIPKKKERSIFALGDECVPRAFFGFPVAFDPHKCIREEHLTGYFAA
jgi:hypothetical protein